MELKSCFLFGHGDVSADTVPQLKAAITEAYLHHGIRCFYVGNRGSFDRLATKALKELKKQFPDTQLILLLAYHPAERKVILPEDFDNSYFPPLDRIPKPYRIVQANRYIVNNVDEVICYVNHIGNSRNLLEYCQKLPHLLITNLGSLS